MHHLWVASGIGSHMRNMHTDFILNILVCVKNYELGGCAKICGYVWQVWSCRRVMNKHVSLS